MEKEGKSVNGEKPTEIFVKEERPPTCVHLPRCYRDEVQSVLITEGEIRGRVKCLAGEVHAAIGDRPLVLVCVFKGAFRFFNTLLDQLLACRAECESPLEVEFVRAKSYENTQSSGALKIDGIDDDSSVARLRDKDILIVDDIFDTGATLNGLVREFQNALANGKGEGRLWTAVLVRKRDVQQQSMEKEDSKKSIAKCCDFVAFSVPNRFVVGWGMDYNERYRDLVHICVLNAHAIQKHRTTICSGCENGENNGEVGGEVCSSQN